MIIRDVRFKNDDDSHSLRKDFEDNLIDLAENLAICMAEVRKWEAFKHAAAQSLAEGMKLLEVSELRTDFNTFKNSDDGVEVTYEKGIVH